MAPIASTVLPTPSETANVALRVEPVRQALKNYEASGSAEQLRTLEAVVRDLASDLLELRKSQAVPSLLTDLFELVRRLGASGAHNQAPTEDAVALVAANVDAWGSRLAMMLLGAAWRWEEVPLLEAVPKEWWTDYSHWIFCAPTCLVAAGDQDRFAAFLQPRLEELATLAERNIGSAAVRGAVAAMESSAAWALLYGAGALPRRVAEARARVLRKASGRDVLPFQPLPFDRHGRALRIGAIALTLSDTLATRERLARLAHLDPERFQVVWFVVETPAVEIEEYLRPRNQEIIRLENSLSDAVNQLRNANLDVVVFASDVVVETHVLSRLPLFRLAPLHVAVGEPISTGFPEFDLFAVGSEADRPELFSERLGIMPGCGTAFDAELAVAPATTEWSREALGIPDETIVFVSAASHSRLTPETQLAWAAILKAVPNSRLLIHPFEGQSGERAADTLSAQFDAVLSSVGLAGERVSISAANFASQADVRALLSVGHVYLDPVGAGDARGVLLALGAGLPVVAAMSAAPAGSAVPALLRAVGTDPCIAADIESYVATAARLATDSVHREEIQRAISEAMSRVPEFMDALAASDAFGELIAVAFDQKLAGSLATAGAPGTLRVAADDAALATAQSLFDIGLQDDALGQLTPLLGATPRSSPLRHLLAKVLAARGHLPRATQYLVAAAQTGELSAEGWLDLARFLRDGGDAASAMTALETAIRMDPKKVESWTMLRDIASRCGHAEMMTDIDKMLADLQADGAGSLAAANSDPR